MTVSRKVLCIVYGLIAMIALVSTWSHALGYMRDGYLRGFNLFWEATLINPASRFITADLLFLVLAIMIWMVMEARRLEIRGVWIYIFFGIFVAISFTFPLFMIHRERSLARREPASAAGTLGVVDIIGLTVVGVMVAAYLARAFAQ